MKIATELRNRTLEETSADLSRPEVRMDDETRASLLEDLKNEYARLEAMPRAVVPADIRIISAETLRAKNYEGFKRELSLSSEYSVPLIRETLAVLPELASSGKTISVVACLFDHAVPYEYIVRLNPTGTDAAKIAITKVAKGAIDAEKADNYFVQKRS